jgi:transcriptional regulator with XRE-family HTH domain
MQARSDTEDGFDLRVRRRLRDLRTQRGLTLEDVATRADIDVSTLSRLESGKRRLALDHLPRLASALSVSTDELLRAPDAEDPRVKGASHTRDGVTYWPLTRGGPAGGLHAFKIRVSARRMPSLSIRTVLSVNSIFLASCYCCAFMRLLRRPVKIFSISLGTGAVKVISSLVTG